MVYFACDSKRRLNGDTATSGSTPLAAWAVKADAFGAAPGQTETIFQDAGSKTEQTEEAARASDTGNTFRAMVAA